MAELIQNFHDTEENKVFAYAVYRNSLVYLFKLRGHLRAGVLETRDLAIRWGDCLYIPTDYKDSSPAPRLATREDFEHYRIQYTEI